MEHNMQSKVDDQKALGAGVPSSPEGRLQQRCNEIHSAKLTWKSI